MPSSLGQRLRDARKAENLTQRELADRLGVINTTISNWEQGVSYPDPATITALCRELHVRPDELLLEDPTQSADRTPTDDELKFALFDAPSGEITDEMMEEVRNFARYVRERERKKTDEGTSTA